MTKSTIEKAPLQITYTPSEEDKYLTEAISLLKNTIERSLENLDKNHILDSFSQNILKILKNPLGAILENIEESEKRIAMLLDLIVQSELQANDKIIKSAHFYEESEINVLMYCIIFKNGDEKNRLKLNRFLMDYEQSDFNPRFKIIFQYIPEEMELSLINCKKIFPV